MSCSRVQQISKGRLRGSVNVGYMLSDAPWRLSLGSQGATVLRSYAKRFVLLLTSERVVCEYHHFNLFGYRYCSSVEIRLPKRRVNVSYHAFTVVTRLK